ncbi:Atp-binding protein, partial [Globisporangium polare]
QYAEIDIWPSALQLCLSAFSLRFQGQSAIVSSDRTLYCSITNEKPAIATGLELNRWYHLTLTYSDQTQRVYLDGELKSTLSDVPVHHEWWALRDVQVGTGCITAGAMNFPTPQSCGWYPFNGLIDNPRVWMRGLSGEEV